jgi:hypothetical protein
LVWRKSTCPDWTSPIGGVFSGDRGRVADVSRDDANGQGNRPVGEFLDGFLGAAHEAGLLDQIAGRIAGDGEFREDDQVCAGSRGFPGEIGHAGDVAAKVADGRIDLPQRDFHPMI